MKISNVKNAIALLSIALAVAIGTSKEAYTQNEAQDTNAAKSVNGLLKLLNRPDDSLKVVALKLLCWDYRNSDPKKAIDFGQKAVTLAQKLNLNYELSDSYNRLGIAYRNKGRYAQALDCYFKGMEVSRQHGYDKILAFQYNNLSDLYNRLDLYERALEFGRRALDVSQKINDDYTTAYIYNILGTIYKNKNLFDSAFINFFKSLELRKKIGFSPGIATSYLNIGSVLLKMQNYDSSMKNLALARDIYESNNDIQGLMQVYLLQGILYNKTREPNKAIHCFNQSLKLNEKFNDLNVSRDAHRGLSEAYAEQTYYQKAYILNKFAFEINDSITTNQDVEKLTQLTEALRFEEQLNVQKEREKALAEKLVYQRNLIRLYIAIILLLTIIVGLSIYFYIKQSKNVRLLQIQKDEINKLNNTKDKFFSILAHDLKNQITSILAIAQMMKEKSIALGDENLIQMSRRLYALGFSTNDLLENILNWIKVQGNQLKIKASRVNLSELAEKVTLTQKPTAEIKMVGLINKIDADINLNTDSDMLGTILRNLISNAIKFSYPGGKIEIDAFIKGKIFEIQVTDYGIGMDETQIKRLLDPTQVDSTPGTQKEQGSGLGLLISKNLINDLGGYLKIDSLPQRGSVFSIILPAELVAS